MVADCGTRPDKVNMEDVLEGGRWHNGAPWMKMTLEEAIHTEAIKPAMDLRINDEEKDDFKEGIVFEAAPEILTRGHNIQGNPVSIHITETKINEKRVEKIEQRSKFSDYIYSPVKLPFKRFMRILQLLVKFIVKKFQNVEGLVSKIGLVEQIPAMMLNHR